MLTSQNYNERHNRGPPGWRHQDPRASDSPLPSPGPPRHRDPARPPPVDGGRGETPYRGVDPQRVYRTLVERGVSVCVSVC